MTASPLERLIAQLVDDGALTSTQYLVACESRPSEFQHNPLVVVTEGPASYDDPITRTEMLGGWMIRDDITRWLAGKSLPDAIAQLLEIGVSVEGLALASRNAGRRVEDAVRESYAGTGAGEAVSPFEGETVSGVRIEYQPANNPDAPWQSLGVGTVSAVGRFDAIPLVQLEESAYTREYLERGLGIYGDTHYAIRMTRVGEGGQFAVETIPAASILWVNPTESERTTAAINNGIATAAGLGVTYAVDPNTGLASPVISGLVGGEALDVILGTKEPVGESRRWVGATTALFLGSPGGGATGVRVRRDGIETEVPFYWEEGDPALFFAGWSEEALAALQAYMEQAGVLRPNSYRLGIWDSTTQETMQVVMSYANQRGINPDDPRVQAELGEAARLGGPAGTSRGRLGYRPGETPSHVLTGLRAGRIGRVASLMVAIASMGEELPFVPAFRPPAARVPDPDTLAQLVRQQYLTSVGRQPSALEMQRFTAHMGNQYRQSLTATQLENERAWIEGYVEQGYQTSAEQQALLDRPAGGFIEEIDPYASFQEAFLREEGPLLRTNAAKGQRRNLRDSLIGSALVGRSM